MAQDFATSYASIIKQEKQADGTLKVYGKATDDSIDSDLQICDEKWLKSAMPAWFETGGNVREQHSNIAAGVATDYEAKADGHYITALVVDPVSVKKVEAGVLKGFSIGIRSPRVVRDEKAINGRIIDGQIVEVSLVDRPANPNAKMMLAKAAEGGELVAVNQLEIPNPAQVFGKSENPVEEIIEAVEAKAEEVLADAEAIVEEVKADAEAIVEEVAEDVQEIAGEKSALPEADLLNTAHALLKFDQATYDSALSALSNLIASEAQEMADGDDERDSIKELLRSVKHLFHWYQGEVAEGEVPGSATPDDVADALADVADALNLSASADPKDLSVDVDSIIAKAVASAKESVVAEIDVLKSALVAEEQKSVELQSQLAEALNKAVQGGPKRAGIVKTDEAKVAEWIAKSAEYSHKASITTDTVLAEGYRELADKFAKKASKRKG